MAAIILGSELNPVIGTRELSTISSSVYVFGNGITELNDTVSLGGDLDTDTTVDINDTYYFRIDGTGESNRSARLAHTKTGTIITAYSDSDYAVFHGYAEVSTNGESGSGTVRTVVVNGSDETGIIINNGTIVLYDDVNTKGATYDADYSSNFTDRSIVDKAYVDTVVTYGTENQIPHMNAGGTAFEYDSDFTWTGSALRLGTGSAAPYISFNQVTNANISVYSDAQAILYLGTYSDLAANNPGVTVQRYGGTLAVPAAAPTNAEVRVDTYTVYDGTNAVEAGEHSFEVDGAIATGDFDTKYTWALKEGASASGLIVTLGVNGFEYAADHSTDQATNDLWIPDKKYVDDTIASSITSTTGYYVQKTTIEYTDADTNVDITPELAAGDIIWDVKLYVNTVFDSDLNHLYIGSEDTNNNYYSYGNAGEVESTGWQTIDWDGTSGETSVPFIPLTGTDTLFARYTDGSVPTAGSADIYVIYSTFS